MQYKYGCNIFCPGSIGAGWWFYRFCCCSYLWASHSLDRSFHDKFIDFGKF